MRYPIVIHPNKKLYEPSTPVEAITPALLKLLDDLHETMLAHDGVGIAAPQVGKNIQVALVEVEAYGYLARAILHEIDHLQGKLFIDQMIEQIPEEELENYMEEKEND